MVRAHSVADIRAAEAEVLPTGPPGFLMGRAATSLAGWCLRLLKERRRPVVGARLVLLVGAGDNGGDALLAGARLARRGLAVVAVLTADTAHPAGMAELAAAGGRVVRSGE